MKRITQFVLACVLAAVLNGCLYTNIKYPLDENLDRTELGTKTGSAYMQSVLWLFAWGDASTKAAATNGELNVINHLDIEQQIYFFGIYSKTTVIAYGS